MKAPAGYVESSFASTTTAPTSAQRNKTTEGPDGELTWTPLSEIAMRPIVFRDKPIWQADAFHLLAGRKNAGKGTYIAGEAARVTRGELGERKTVLWIASGEDSYAIDVRPRIEAAGGLVERVRVLERGQLVLPKHVNEIRLAAEDSSDVGMDVGMVVIDPLGDSLGAGKDSNKDTDVRPALTCLNRLADEFRCVVVGVRHLSNKDIRNGALSAVLGASDWVNVPRVVLTLVHDDQDENLRHLTVATGNRVKSGTGRIYRIEGVNVVAGGEEVTRAVYVGESTKNPDDLLQAARPTSRSGQARELILDALEAAPDKKLESDTLDALIVKQTGLSAKTAKNQRAALAKDGLIKSLPIKDESGAITGWMVARTNAPREAEGA